eukprot:GAHX01007873.1.p1 GENE.GAHX01007873.1~~GAHX01007873.1.p1  ORF type:complete len:53 (-),score=0.28 GAHX01007873.1:176-334(-)
MKKKRCLHASANLDDPKECKHFISRLFLKYINSPELINLDIILYARYHVANM